MTETTLKPVTRNLYLYGKDGKAKGPTKAYPNPKVVKQEATLIKDYGQLSLWKFEPYPPAELEPLYWISFHGKNGETSGGSGYRTEEGALAGVEKTFAFWEYNARKSELYREHKAKVDALDAEYKGRI